MIPTLVEHWEQGYENVYTVITKRHGEGPLRRGLAQAFYWLINKVSDTPVPRNTSDFRLVSKAAYEAFNGLQERNRMVRTMWGWLGFHRDRGGVRTPRRAREARRNSARSPAGFAIRGILGSSYTPLKLIPLMGATLSALSFIALGGIVIHALFFGVPFPGFGTIVSLTLLMFGFLFLLLGVVSEYIGMIFEESRRRPSYIVRQRDGIDD